MKFFNLSVHISVISDLKNIFESLGIEVTNFCLSGHSWVLNKEPDIPKIITPHSWFGLNDELIAEFQKEYDEFLSGFDGFIVDHPFSFVRLFEKYNKPVFGVAAARYDAPYCMTGNTKEAQKLNECIQRMYSSGQLRVIANNLGDLAYLNLALKDIRITHIPSLCAYPNLKWDMKTSLRKFLVYTGEDIVPSHPILVKRSELGKFEWKTLMEFRGIIHIPYEISTMSIFEHMEMGIPLFLPSKQFLFDLWQSKKAKFQSDYWSVISKTEPPDYHQLTKDYSFWIEKADFYNVQGIYYFDSFDHLLSIVVTFFKDIKHIERPHNRKEVITGQWKSLLKDIL